MRLCTRKNELAHSGQQFLEDDKKFAPLNDACAKFLNREETLQEKHDVFLKKLEKVSSKDVWDHENKENTFTETTSLVSVILIRFWSSPNHYET